MHKIISLLAIALAAVATFVGIPYAAAILVVLGIEIGLAAPEDAHMRVLVSALVLNGLSHVWDAIPGIGSYLTGFIGNVGLILAGAATTIVCRNIYLRLVKR